MNSAASSILLSPSGLWEGVVEFILHLLMLLLRLSTLLAGLDRCHAVVELLERLNRFTLFCPVTVVSRTSGRLVGFA